MNEKLKIQMMESVADQLPNADSLRLESLLAVIELEIETYNDCKKAIDWEKLRGIITEILYHSAKNELDKTVESVKRGDTTISYATSDNQTRNLIANYKDLIRQLIGCSEVIFW